MISFGHLNGSNHIRSLFPTMVFTGTKSMMIATSKAMKTKTLTWSIGSVPLWLPDRSDWFLRAGVGTFLQEWISSSNADCSSPICLLTHNISYVFYHYFNFYYMVSLYFDLSLLIYNFVHYSTHWFSDKIIIKLIGRCSNGKKSGQYNHAFWVGPRRSRILKDELVLYQEQARLSAVQKPRLFWTLKESDHWEEKYQKQIVCQFPCSLRNQQCLWLCLLRSLQKYAGKIAL